MGQLNVCVRASSNRHYFCILIDPTPAPIFFPMFKSDTSSVRTHLIVEFSECHCSLTAELNAG